jgi:hypothetical protein
MIQCSNASDKYEHLFCKECIKGYIESAINDKNATNKCMMHTETEPCNGVFNDADIKNCIDENNYKNYEEMVIIKEIYTFAKIFDNYSICPFCNKFGICCDYAIDEMKYLECKRCNNTWCRECKKKSHGTESCYKIKNENESDEFINKVVTETITEAVAHKCPKCYTKYIKLEGCNLITCATCHSYSCYLCGKLILDKINKYEHFHNNQGSALGKCILFNDYGDIKRDQGNEKYNNANVIKACEQLLKENDIVNVQKKLLTAMFKNDVDIKLLDKKYKTYFDEITKVNAKVIVNQNVNAKLIVNQNVNANVNADINVKEKKSNCSVM